MTRQQRLLFALEFVFLPTATLMLSFSGVGVVFALLSLPAMTFALAGIAGARWMERPSFFWAFAHVTSVALAVATVLTLAAGFLGLI